MSEMYTTSNRSIVPSWCRWPGASFRKCTFFLSLLRCFALHCIAVSWQHSHSARKRQVEAVLHTLAIATAIDQGMRHKLQQTPTKATETEDDSTMWVRSVYHTSYCSYGWFWICPYSDWGGDKLPFGWQCPTWECDPTILISDVAVHVNLLIDRLEKTEL